MLIILKKLHRIWYLLCVLFFFILLFPLLYILTRNPDRYYSTIASLRRIISVLGTTFSGIFFKIEYESCIDWSKPYVICPNHTSILDITGITFMCPQSFSFMGKIELLRNPVTRIFFRSIDIVVDRKSKISAYKAFKKADYLIKTGKSIVIFPEGKIDDEYPPRLHEFKSGSFKLAVDNQVQILPVVIQDAWQTLWDNGEKFGSKPGIIHIQVLAPIDTKNITSVQADEIQSLVYDKMSTHWNKFNSFIDVKKTPTNKNI
ncbi:MULTISPECIES: lysophospholipid acyltransferase family protein [Sphingobacterium]|uniref:lysophospholipid acyltransferase family protein n=1 Tax=Sphingobacterium TaxID=28453 RepID=UPI0013D96008|nr:MULTISPECIES: lysophospholipid acyltransferase family protein [unclassified Sphingobacterium]